MTERITSFGIDFGTSNSSIATVIEDQAKVFDLGSGNMSQPSSIFIRADGYHSVGLDAIEDFHNPQEHSDNYHFIPSVKPGLPIELYEGNILQSRLGERRRIFFPVEDIASYLISDLKRKAELTLGYEVEKTVLGRPVVFSEDEELDKMAEDRLLQAARNAGFSEIYFVMEPIAAALHFERFYKKPEQKKVFIFDFGGGTLDTCILELEESNNLPIYEDMNRRVLSSHGIDLGGNDLDKDVFMSMFLPYFGSEVMWGDNSHLSMPIHIHNDITDWHLLRIEEKMDLLNFLRQIAVPYTTTDREAIKRLITLIDHQQMFALLRSIEQAKIDLSRSESSTIEHQFENIYINEPLNAQQFNEYVKSEKGKIRKCIRETLSLAGLTAQDIDVVIRVGGSSGNSFIQDILYEMFNNVEETEIFTSVVAGLALAADDIFR